MCAEIIPFRYEAAKTQSQEMEAVLVRLQMAADPLSELSIWLRERSTVNRRLGGNEVGLASLVATMLAQVGLPIKV